MSGSTIPSLNIKITAQDVNAAKTLDAVGKRAAQTGSSAENLGKSLSKLGDTSGLSKLTEGFQGLNARAFDAFRSMDRLAPALGVITGAASLAGMATLVTRWGQLGQQTFLTGQRLGVPTDRLTALQGAARLAGSSAEDLTSGLGALDEKLRGATFRGDGNAIQTFNVLKVGFGDVKNGARNAGEAFGDVADGIKRLYDSGDAGRGAAMRAAQNLGLESLFPLLIKGKAGIQALQAEAARLGAVISPEAAKRADALKTSFTRLDEAVEGVANRLGDRWGAVVKPYIDSASSWIGNNKSVADSYTEIGVSIMALGALKPAAWLAGLLGINLGAAAGAGLGAAGVMDIWRRGLTGNIPDQNYENRMLGNIPGIAPNGLRSEAALHLAPPISSDTPNWWQRNAPPFLGGIPSGVRNINPPKAGTAAADVMQQTHDFWRSKGLDERATAGILTNIAAESSFNPTLSGDHGEAYGLYQHNGPRMAALKAWSHTDTPSVQQQNEFAWHELNEPGMAKTLYGLQHPSSTENATGVFATGFERPAGNFFTPNGPSDRMGASQKFDGTVVVTVDLKNAHPGTTASVTTTGPVTAAPPRVETAMQGLH